MSYSITEESKSRAKRCAERLGVVIPGYIEIEMWSLPILEVLIDRIEALEKQLKEKSG